MSPLAKSNPPRKAKAADVPWLSRLTHPLVFFGAAIAVFEGTIGTALFVGTHSDITVIWLCVLMAVVIMAATFVVALLVFFRPQHLMLGQQDAIGQEIMMTTRIRAATKLLMEAEKPQTPAELFQLMDAVEAALNGGLRK